jgi:acetyltransferase-like isoleucine patch superfamily enzyme
MRLGEDTYLFRIRKWLLTRKARKYFDSFGKGSEFRPGAYAAYPKNIAIGKNVSIRPGCRLLADDRTFIIIGDDVLLGHGVHFYTNNHSYDRVDIPIVEQGYSKHENVILDDGCWIGANAIILPGVMIGKSAVVGAGSIVTRDVPAGEIWAGNPCRRIKKRRTEDVIREEIPVPDTRPKRLYRTKR